MSIQFLKFTFHLYVFPGVQSVKSLPAMPETRVQSLGQENLLEKEMATHSSTFAWKIPWAEDPGRLESMGLQRVRHDQGTSLLYGYYKINPALT